MVRGRLLVISRHQTRLLLSDPGSLVIFLLVPLLVMVILKTTQKAALLAAGIRTSTGQSRSFPD